MQVIREVDPKGSTHGPSRGVRAQLCRDDPEGLHYVRVLDPSGDPLVVTAAHEAPKDAVAEIQRLMVALSVLPLGDLLGSSDGDRPPSTSERPPGPAV